MFASGNYYGSGKRNDAPDFRMRAPKDVPDTRH